MTPTVNNITPAQKLVTPLKALSHPARLSIVDALLKHPQCVTELLTTTCISQPRISQHLKLLKEAGIVEVQRDGTRRYYFLLKPQEIKKFLQSLSKINKT